MPVLSFGTSSENLNFPDIRPSLDLNFAKTKVLDPRITFTRASTGTYVGNDGLIKTAAVNEPRFDHNPTTGESLGLLVEESRTNLLLNSSSNWTAAQGTISDDLVTAPDGTLTADKFVANTSTSLHGARKDFSATVGTTYTFSVFVKSAEYSRVLISDNAFSTWGVTYDLTTNSLIQSGGTQYVSSSISDSGSGFKRISVTYTASQDVVYHATCGVPSNVVGSLGSGYSSAGDGTSGIYIWGAQLEVGSFPTSYIPTTSATVTRSADVASITGTNFSSWYRQDEGTMFARSGVNRVFDGTRLTLEFGDGTNNNRFFLANNGFTSASYFYAVSSGVSQVVSTSPNAFSSGTANNAITYKTDDFALVSNGATPVLDTSGTVPTVSTLYIGKLGSTTSTNMWCGTISRLTYWPKRLSNDQLRLLTQ